MSRVDQQLPARLVARVEEQHDELGDVLWTLALFAATHDRAELDRVAAALDLELEFAPTRRGAA